MPVYTYEKQEIWVQNGNKNIYGIAYVPDRKGEMPLLKGDNKELMIIPDAVHTDLYDGGDHDYIPFDKMTSFFEEYLK